MRGRAGGQEQWGTEKREPNENALEQDGAPCPCSSTLLYGRRNIRIARGRENEQAFGVNCKEGESRAVMKRERERERVVQGEE